MYSVSPGLARLPEEIGALADLMQHLQRRHG
jgi:hypothetical protein